MKMDRILLTSSVLVFACLATVRTAAAAGTGEAARLRMGTVRLTGDGTLHFQFRKAPAADRRIEKTDVFSHNGVRYEGQSLRAVVDWLSRRNKPTPAAVLAKADPKQFLKSLGPAPRPVDEKGLIFVPRSTPRAVPRRKPVVAGSAAEVLRLVNATRRQYGLQPLSLHSGLCAACGDHSRTMASYGFFSHSSPVAGRYSFTQRAQAHGATAGAENIAMGAGSAAAVVQMWLSSPGHAANLLNPGFRTMGIGRAGGYWTQMFGY